MLFIGDIHGNHKKYMDIISSEDDTFQVGDMGLGFFGFDMSNFKPKPKDKFIRGNHDNPETCRNNPNYLGDFGFKDGIFFISGADSIDKEYRTIGLDWWKDEELSYNELCKVLELYKKEKPEVVVSHCAPLSVIAEIFGSGFRSSLRSRTESVLGEMLSYHRPKYWIFGHYHRRWTKDSNGTKFVCLNLIDEYSTTEQIRLATFSIPELKWT